MCANIILCRAGMCDGSLRYHGQLDGMWTMMEPGWAMEKENSDDGRVLCVPYVDRYPLLYLLSIFPCGSRSTCILHRNDASNVDCCDALLVELPHHFFRGFGW